MKTAGGAIRKIATTATVGKIASGITAMKAIIAEIATKNSTGTMTAVGAVIRTPVTAMTTIKTVAGIIATTGIATRIASNISAMTVIANATATETTAGDAIRIFAPKTRAAAKA